MRFGLIVSLAAFVLATSLSSPLRAQAAPGRGADGIVPARRTELERQFRERTAQIVRRQLKLNDSQMTRLQAVNQSFDRERVALMAEERQTRQALRAELMAGDAANQQKVGTLLDQLMRLQRRRLDQVENEQRELGKFLTPVQRAKYFGLQNQLRKRMQELRDGAGPGGPPGDAPARRMTGPRARRILR